MVVISSLIDQYLTSSAFEFIFLKYNFLSFLGKTFEVHCLSESTEAKLLHARFVVVVIVVKTDKKCVTGFSAKSKVLNCRFVTVCHKNRAEKHILNIRNLFLIK